MGLGGQVADAAASALDPSVLLDLAQGVSGWLVAFLTAAFFVLAYVIFMAADAAVRTCRAGARGRRPGVDRPDPCVRLVGAPVLRRNASFGAVVAIIDGLALWALGIPVPAVWAILAFVTNFIPNIGFVLGLVPPAVLAFVVGGAPLMLGVIAIYAVVNVVLQVLSSPSSSATPSTCRSR